MLANIKSNLILKKIFMNIIDLKRLKIIKHTKKLMNKLNVGLEDFKEYILLKE